MLSGEATGDASGAPEDHPWSRASRLKISAVVACYRDSQAIPVMYRRLDEVFQRIGVDGEMIFVNDASPDDAHSVLTALALQDPRVVVINHSRNYGSQSAFTSGMRVATGDAVALLDGDLQDPPELIADFYARWREGYDVVYGSRVGRQAPAWMRIAYKVFYRVFRAASYLEIPLDAGDFSLMDRRVVDALNSLPETHRFIRGLRAWVGFRQIGVPYVRPERLFGRSTNSLLRNVGWARRAILSFSYAPLELITLLSLVVTAAAFLLAITEVIVRLVVPQSVPSGFTTVIVLVLFIGGIQLLCLSIIGAYISHIYEEVKHRPPYIVESALNLPEGRTREDES